MKASTEASLRSCASNAVRIVGQLNFLREDLDDEADAVLPLEVQAQFEVAVRNLVSIARRHGYIGDGEA